MSDVFSSIGNVFSKVMNAGGGKLVPGLLTGAGAVSNFLTGRKQTQAIDQQLAWNKYVQNLVSNPAAFSKFAAGYTQPLTAGLTSGVENQAQSWLQEHGLSESPTISQDVLMQALAPYIQQQQNTGLQAALNALNQGGGSSTAQLPFYAKGNDMTQLLKLLMTKNTGAAPTGSQPSLVTNPADFSDFQPDLNTGLGGTGGFDLGALSGGY